MTDIDIRVVEPADIDALVASVAGLFAEDAGASDPGVDTTWPDREGAGYYSGLIGDDACLLALAWAGDRGAGDRVVGHLVGKLREPTDLNRDRIAVLESIRVHPDARNAGVGSLLVDHFRDWARRHDAGQASVTAYAVNTAAQRFYARHGFVPSLVTMRAAL